MSRSHHSLRSLHISKYYFSLIPYTAPTDRDSFFHLSLNSKEIRRPCNGRRASDYLDSALWLITPWGLTRLQTSIPSQRPGCIIPGAKLRVPFQKLLAAPALT